MSGRLVGKTALVTGGTSGIGKAIATRLAAEGARVVISGRDAERGADIVATLGEGARFVAADLSADGARALAKATVAEFGGVPDILVNNAGIFPTHTTTTLPESTFDDIVNVNIKAPFYLVAELAPGMAERGSGSIINLGSWVASLAIASSPMYAASKATLELLTKAWAAEFGRSGIRVNAVAPGVIATERFAPFIDALSEMMATSPSGRPGLPEEIAAVVAFLAGDDASFINAGIIPVDGGRANAI